MDTRSLYQVIAKYNPSGAKQVIRDFGYKETNNNLARNLEILVAQEGESALKSIVELHPHKDVILEVSQMNSNKETFNNACGCQKCKSRESWNNADGWNERPFGSKTDAGQLTIQTNAMIFAGVLVMALAVIATRK